MSKVIILPVKAKHFKDADYLSISNCPISNAASDFFQCRTYEGVDYLITYPVSGGKKYFDHVSFYLEDCQPLAEVAKEWEFDETIIFELELTEV